MSPIFEKLTGFGIRTIMSRDSEYDEDKKLFNDKIVNEPLAICYPTNESEVAKVVRIARDENLIVTVRGGRHGPAGFAVGNGAIVIDLSELLGIEVDRESATVTVAAGEKWKAVDTATTPFGLATTGGSCSMVGVVGFTLGGGYGYLARSFGMGCDQLLSARIVNAESKTLDVDHENHSELFWGLRGAGCGNFGVVTRLQLRLHTIPETMYGGAVIWPLKHRTKIASCVRDLLLDEENQHLTLNMAIQRFPFPTGEWSVIVNGLFVGELSVGQARLNPLERLGGHVLNLMGECRYFDIQSDLDEDILVHAQGMRAKWKSGYIPPEHFVTCTEVLADFATCSPSSLAVLSFDMMGGGALANKYPAATAFPHRLQAFGYCARAFWRNEQADEANEKWVHQLHDELAAYRSEGSYFNYADPDIKDWGKAYFSANLPRLIQLKRTVDPDNRFRFPQGLSELI